MKKKLVSQQTIKNQNHYQPAIHAEPIPCYRPHTQFILSLFIYADRKIHDSNLTFPKQLIKMNFWPTNSLQIQICTRFSAFLAILINQMI